MDTKHTTLATIGYEAADLADFIATLRVASVKRIIDVQQLAISRRKGFAKTALSAALADAGISYVHLRELGDPKAGREAARAGNFGLFRTIFTSQMKTDGAQADLRTASRLVAEGGACLLCFERDHTGCHRSIVAQAIYDNLPVTFRHIGVKAGLAAQKQTIVIREFAEARA